MASLSGNFFDAIELLYLAVVIRLYRCWDLIRVVFRYYSHPAFRRVDRILLQAYLFDNPYTLTRRYLEQQGETEVNTYGETPLVTLELIAKRCQIQARDVVFELGSGRGRCCFWLRCLIGCHVVGIEMIPPFVWKAQRIASKANISGIDFRCEDFLQSELSGGTVYYLYGSTLEDAQLKRLVHRFAKLPKGTRFITVSFPLSDYADKSLFQLLDSFPADFLWGSATVYLEVKR